MCVFFGDFNVTTPQRRSSTHSLSQSHTHTHTLTHMTGQQWLIGQVVLDIFRGLQIFFWTTSGQQEFFRPPGGHATSENISRVLKMFRLFMFVLYAGTMLQ